MKTIYELIKNAVITILFGIVMYRIAPVKCEYVFQYVILAIVYLWWGMSMVTTLDCFVESKEKRAK